MPGVITYSLCYACVKTLNYAILMWLPYFLSGQYQIDSHYIGIMTNIYDVASLVGAFGFGWITDKLGHRAPILSLIMFLTLPVLGVFDLVPFDAW